MYKRTIQLNEIIDKKSLFLLGPRQTGKSTLLRNLFSNARFVDLLESETFRQLSIAPESLRQTLKAEQKIIVIDEIQKLPEILDEVQLLIDRNPELRFVLTGSSPRKLRRNKANLLGGRALSVFMHPLTYCEIGTNDLSRLVNWGGLPSIYDSDNPKRDLGAYVGTYLQEEIQAEGLVRSIPNFSRVLQFASHLNSQQVNYTKLANDAQIKPRTVHDYVDLLKDTLIVHLLPPFKNTTSRKTVSTEKLYFFDCGVARFLLNRNEVVAGSPEYGQAIEHLIFLELIAFRDYHLADWKLSYWRSQSKLEVDFLINEKVAIEVKATNQVGAADLRGLRALAEDFPKMRKIVVASEPIRRVLEDKIEIIPVNDFLQELWSGQIA